MYDFNGRELLSKLIIPLLRTEPEINPDILVKSLFKVILNKEDKGVAYT